MSKQVKTLAQIVGPKTNLKVARRRLRNEGMKRPRDGHWAWPASDRATIAKVRKVALGG